MSSRWGVPIALFIAGRVKLKARISSFFIGAGTYLLFAMLLGLLLHVLVIQFCGLNAQSRPWLYYVYAALAAAVFEETGRLIAMKFWMKKWLDFPNALMYGIGHGGVEAILLESCVHADDQQRSHAEYADCPCQRGHYQSCRNQRIRTECKLLPTEIF